VVKPHPQITQATRRIPDGCHDICSVSFEWLGRKHRSDISSVQYLSSKYRGHALIYRHLVRKCGLKGNNMFPLSIENDTLAQLTAGPRLKK
jgi:hypothetical protein